MTSDFGYARLGDSVMHRMGVMADTTLREFQAFLTAGPSWAARHRLFEGIKRRVRHAVTRTGATLGQAGNPLRNIPMLAPVQRVQPS